MSFKLSKCCFFFPLRPGCQAIAIILTLLSLIGFMNKMVDLSLLDFNRTSTNSYDDTRMANYVTAKVIRCVLYALMEMVTVCSSILFMFGIAKEKLQFLTPLIAILFLKSGHFLVYYFDLATKHVETNDQTGAIRLYIFGIIISLIYFYLWLCTYSYFQDVKLKKEQRIVGEAGVVNPNLIM